MEEQASPIPRRSPAPEVAPSDELLRDEPAPDQPAPDQPSSDEPAAGEPRRPPLESALTALAEVEAELAEIERAERVLAGQSRMPAEPGPAAGGAPPGVGPTP
ncbi:MAG: hypothetical protein ACRDYD_11650 [Acidimicrobiales bacterium]